MDNELDRLKGAFLAIISHELRTPLTEIIAALNILREGYLGSLNERQQQYVTIAESAADRLNSLIGDLIAFAQLQAEAVETRPQATRLVDLAGTVVEQHQPRALAKHQNFSLEKRADLPPIAVDRALMTRVIANLVINAINFTPEGGRVTVRVRDERNAQCIDVIDTGTGIPKDKQAHIFESFYQANDHLTRQVGGLGIGLAYARRIVEAHGGEITFTSVEGKGSTFTVRLPLKSIQSHS